MSGVHGVKAFRRKRKMYHEQKGLCYWCHRKMRDVDDRIDGGPLPPDYPTIDHLDETFTGRRGKYDGLRRRVVACHECNGSRSNDHMPIEEERQRKADGDSPSPGLFSQLEGDDENG